MADVGQLVRERVVTLLPDADPSFQPVDGGIVNLPTIFAAGEPESVETEPFDVLGFTVTVTATARWEWTFEPGTTQEFTVARRRVSRTTRSATPTAGRASATSA